MRKRTRENCSRVVQYGDAASLLAKLCPRGGRAAKQRRTVGRLAEVLCVSTRIAAQPLGAAREEHVVSEDEGIDADAEMAP